MIVPLSAINLLKSDTGLFQAYRTYRIALLFTTPQQSCSMKILPEYPVRIFQGTLACDGNSK